MRVRFSAAVMADSGSWRTLDRIVMLFEEERHEWLADDPEGIEVSAWLRSDAGRAGASNRKALQEHIRWSAYPKPRLEVTVDCETTSELTLGPADALRCMEAPVSVAVENATTDGDFLRTMVHALDRGELRQALERRWLMIAQMGGFGEVEKTVVRLRDGMPGPCRVFVLTDSDAQYPGERTATVEKVEETCQRHGVPFAILRKRKIENYLPVSVLNRLAGHRHREVFQAFLHLSPDQRDHYDMKNGLEADERGHAILPPEQQRLFHGVRGHVLRNLCGGFGKGTAEVFRTQRHCFAEADVRQVCAGDEHEIDRILDQIERLL